MEELRYKAPGNQLEQDHYDTALDFFTQQGASADNLRDTLALFERYDDVKDEVVEKMTRDKIDPDYIRFTKELTSKRAMEIVFLAHDRCKKQTKNTWRHHQDQN